MRSSRRSRHVRLPIHLCGVAAGLLLCAQAAAGQARSVRFSRILVEDGLPAAAVYQSLQDRHGFIWLATPEGLSRFDGFDFVTYRHDARDPSSLGHNHVWTILEARDGSLWAGSDGGGLSRFDPASGSFTTYRHDPRDPTSLGGDRVRAVLEDPSGALWVSTDGGGLGRLDRTTESFEHWRHVEGDPATLSSDHARDLVWRRGRLWIATDGGGLSVLDPESSRMTHYRHDAADAASLGSNRVRRLYQDSRGTLWVGTYDHGLYRYDDTTDSFEAVSLASPQGGTEGERKISAILQDHAGTLWIGTDLGLYERRLGSEHFASHHHDATDPRSLTHETVVSLFEDRGGVLWVGTLGGLATWNTDTGSFVHYFHSEEPDQLSDNWVTGFAEGTEGEVWVGTINGLNRFVPASGRFVQFHHVPGDSRSLSDDRVMSLLVDRTGTLWAGTLAGLNRLDSARGTFTRFRSDPSNPTTLSGDGIIFLFEDGEGILWIGAYRQGLNRFDRATGRFTQFRHDANDLTSLSSDRVTSAYEDQAGVLWIGTDDGGLNRYDRNTGRFTHFRHDPADPESLSGDDVLVVTGDQDDSLWVGSRSSGLNKWRAEDRHQGRARFTRYTTDDGLTNPTVFAILSDGLGDLWLSTQNGLSRFHIESETFTNYYAMHGLQSNEFNHGARMRTRDGLLFFGGINGFNRFDPRRVRTNPHVPPVVLTSFLKFNQPVDLGAPPTEVDQIRLGFRDSVISFEFAALDYTAPSKNRYAFMLEGLDPDWVEAGGLRHATYTNLAPGNYVFRVKASNNDGLWNEDGIKIAVIMAPPPWLSWWAYTLYALALGLVVALVLQALARRHRRAEELQRINDSLEGEIETRKAKERALQAEKLKAREYLDVAEVVMVALDPRGEVLLVNQKGCRVLGYTEAEIVGSDWIERFVPAERREEVRGILGRIENFPYCEYPLVTQAGEERVIAWHSTELPAVPGSAPVILCSGTDNTEVRQLEKQVRMQQKMDALGTMAGGIAHDFNNILTAILGYSTLTLSQLSADSEESGYMRHVVKGCERARDMVARILTFSRRETPDRKPIDIGPVIQEACDLLHSSLPANIEIRTIVGQTRRVVTADPTQIHQVIMNLGTNAGHAMPQGGLLEIRVEMIEVAPGALGMHGELRRGSYAQISVADTGNGMDKATMERIFDPFFTTKEVGSGTGLGLSVAHGIVKNHEGDISVKSSPGQGTTVVVRLPCSEEAVEPIAEAEPVHGGSERILLIDDEKPILLLGQKWLESLGYTVEPHCDGVEALAAFRAQPRRFDLVVTDQSMPEIKGFELVREMRRLKATLPVVLTSGRRFESESAEHRCVWLQKPFTASDLAASVRQALDDTPAGLRSVS